MLSIGDESSVAGGAWYRCKLGMSLGNAEQSVRNWDGNRPETSGSASSDLGMSLGKFPPGSEAISLSEQVGMPLGNPNGIGIPLGKGKGATPEVVVLDTTKVGVSLGK